MVGHFLRNFVISRYMCCFSTVEIKISTVFGSVLHSEHVADSRTVAWAVIDLMDDKTEKPCNTFWSYETAPSRPQVRSFQRPAHVCVSSICNLIFAPRDLIFRLMQTEHWSLIVVKKCVGAMCHSPSKIFHCAFESLWPTLRVEQST